MEKSQSTKTLIEENKNLYTALINAALSAKNNAYAPYSNFKVGAAIFSDLEKIYVGANVENIAYPQGLCAEASAIASMIVDGSKQIKNIAVVSDGENPICPCGGCVQKILEFSNDKTKIHIVFKDKIFRTYTTQDIAPIQFKTLK